MRRAAGSVPYMRLASMLAGRQGRQTQGMFARQLQTASTAARQPGDKAAHEISSEDERTLRDIFDLPTKTTLGSRWYHQGQPTGLLMESRFVSPKSFRKAGKQAVAEAEQLVARILQAQTDQERRQVLKCLDQLSDALCRVMDVAELVRQVHPDSAWQTAADEVYAEMFDYMNGLNTHVGLYRKLVEVMDDPESSRMFSPVEREAALSFRRDFERSGIHLSDRAHEQFVRLSAGIHEHSRGFLRAQAQPLAKDQTVDVPLEHLRWLPSYATMDILQASQSHKHADGKTYVRLEPDDYTAHYILRDCEDEGTRELVYRAWQRGSSEAVRSLETLLKQRLDLAHTVGYESFGHMMLDDKMAKSPGHVDEFLRGLAAQASPRWTAVAQALRDTKGSDVFPWDREHLVSRRQMDCGALPSLMPYFSLGRVVLGLSRVFKSLYGVELRATIPQPGEIWHPEVRKLEAVDEHGRLLGLVYCDVFARASKSHVGAAHFTSRCARRIDDDISVGGGEAGYSSQTVVERDGKKFQLPVVVLICDFSAPSEGAPPLLTWANVETIFHERGHAMHSMLGQNGYHNVAGTRCPVDFVELPSILMEHFARSPNVLSLFASHYKTDAPLPAELVRKQAELRRQSSALDLHSQLFMSALDQRYHSAQLAASGEGRAVTDGWSTRVLAEVHRDSMFRGPGQSPANTLLAYVRGTRWQSRFTHLIGYGASYYAYLFDRVLAGQIWNRVFGGDYPHSQTGHGAGVLNPLNRDAGERFKNEVLQWGGGRNPWLSLAAVLDNGRTPVADIEAIAQGDRSAMRTVGSWQLPDI
ncbi:Mitochondrial intermediate peptidase [Coemansia erecta]|uniref:mitochondrial intermediate peptidase n=1 Tax=Coemansia erecta TaxID=147472 RepID=A0A9W7Y2X0_9FUNG|nr:Mitochondrial intermediate peptidase [Coemansia erecta]